MALFLPLLNEKPPLTIDLQCFSAPQSTFSTHEIAFLYGKAFSRPVKSLFCAEKHFLDP